MAENDSKGAAHFKPDAKPHQHESPRVRHHSWLFGFGVVLAVIAGLALVGLFVWLHRPVSITMDGEPRTVFMGTTIGELYNREMPDVSPGNRISVAGNVLDEGQGNPFTCTINGEERSYVQSVDYRLQGGEDVVYGNGDDAMEEYTVEVCELMPKLEFDIREGTPEKGYMVQRGTVQYVSQWGKAGVHELRRGNQSGETGDGEVIEEAQNCVVTVQNIHPDNDEKLVALTFDDGPSYYTEPYLSILAEHDVKATFNIIGDQAQDGQQVIAETASAGHQIASHTWDHQQLTTLDADQVKQELGDTAATLTAIVGSPVTYLRPPYGDLDDEVWLKSGGTIGASVYWTHDSLDWEKPGVDAIVQNSTGNMAPGSVILMHDGGGERDQDKEALPRIIQAWQDAGYRFVTMQELMESDSSIDLSAVNMGSMPPDAVWPTELA